MKKYLIVTIGILLILLVLGVWIYLLFFGTPENGDDVFNNLGFGNAPITPQEIVPEPVLEESFPTIDTKDALRQLTTRPVAGFGFVGTSSYLIRYVERGTGHVYEIDTENGTETRVSGTTIPQIVEAVFSESGNSIALVSENDTTRTIYTGKILEDAENIDFLTLPSQSFEPYFVDDNTLHYALSTNIGTDGYRIDIRDETSIRIFSIPIRDIRVLWGDEIFVYNKPSALAPGALYKVNSFLKPITPQSFGYVGGVNDLYYFGSENSDREMISYVQERGVDAQIPLAVNYIPDKCAHIESDNTLLWCAVPFTTQSDTFIEDWYKGVVLSEDVLWKVSIDNGSAELAANFLSQTGRYVDVEGILSSYDGTVPVFRNKIDGTLWLFDSTVE